MPKDINKNKSINRAKTVTELVISAVVLAAGGFMIKSAADDARIVPQSQFVDMEQDIKLPGEDEVIDPNMIIFAHQSFSTKDKFAGELILVNNEYQYFSTGEEDLISISEQNDEEGRSSFAAFDYSYLILSSVYKPMAKMIDDFYGIYNNDTLVIYGSYRTNAFQQELYDQFTANQDDEEAPIVAKPGYSEHETGYAFDFSENVNYDYQGDGDFRWLNENCYKYGFIIRYPENKEKITEFRYEPWHFRYVGIPHATYMMKNDLCLEEYIDLLRSSHSYDSEHLEITDASGAEFEVYFYPSDDASETTDVPVPTGYKYDISGNNVDGFIVTVHKSEKVSLGNENPNAGIRTTEPAGSEAPEEPENVSE